MGVMGASGHVEMTSDQHARRRALEHRLAAVGWGLFFLWMETAILVGLSTGVGALGIGLITLGAQAARIYLGLENVWFVRSPSRSASDRRIDSSTRSPGASPAYAIQPA